MTGVNFLWHMHQPDYRPAAGGPAILPWVRLHAVRGYLDLLSVLEEFPRAHCTVNFSGILLEQILSYSPDVRDAFAQLSLRNAADLTPSESGFVLEHFFSANVQTLIRPQPRYWELYRKREQLVESRTHAKSANQFEPQELTDLLVWFNLAWIGFAGRRREDVRELIEKGRGYSLDDQRQVLTIHSELLAEVLPRYRRLADSGVIELSVTPHHHPILPLLDDLAGEGPQVAGDPLPEFSYPQDAAEQVRRGMLWYQSAFGHAPLGAWPAEGSVSDAALRTLAAAGLRWAATDQQNLPGGELAHLTPWRWCGGDSEVLMFFRDTRLADNVGFEYANWDPEEAARHLTDHIAELGRKAPNPQPIVSVILDGENPWESYPDGGEGFLRALLAKLTSHRELRCVTPSSLLAGSFPELDHIKSGSWIGGNFDIWSRDAEARHAWRLLARARSELNDFIEGGRPCAPPAGKSPEPSGRARGPAPSSDVYDHILAAEGSDWFWWYGETFQSDQKPQFDELFRGHLLRAYELAGIEDPPEMHMPIASPGKQTTTTGQGSMARGRGQELTDTETDLSDWIV